MVRTLALSAVLAASALACATPAGPAPEKREASMDALDLSGFEKAADAIGKRVRVVGTAQNAKLGAVVEGERLVVYCEGLDSWPAAQVGKPVTVTGVLTRTDDFKATVGPHGEISQGSAGGDWVLEHPKVE